MLNRPSTGSNQNYKFIPSERRSTQFTETGYGNSFAKKASLDSNTLKNYRPISNISFVSKLIERLVAKRINDYLRTHSLLNKYRSAYRMLHSTESALLRIQNDIPTALNGKNMVALVMLDLSSAFDTIDNTILFKRLETVF